MDELLNFIGFFAPFADGIAFGKLNPAFLRNNGTDWSAIFFQYASNPVTDTNHRLHLTVLKAIESTAIIKESAYLRTQTHGRLLNCGPLLVIKIPKASAVPIVKTHLTQVWQVPVKVAHFSLKLGLPETGITFCFFCCHRVFVVGNTKMASTQDH